MGLLANLLAPVKRAVVKPEQSMADLVKEIHETFYSASDKVLAHNQKVLANTLDENVALMAKRYRAVGFSGMPQCGQVAEFDRQQQRARERVGIVQRYAMRYPQYKFIFKDQVTAVCEKYGLYCSDVVDRKGQGHD